MTPREIPRSIDLQVRLRSIQVGLPRTQGGESSDAGNGPWTSGIFKDSVGGPIWLGRENLRGDQQADLVHHGGPDKAVCAYSADHWAYWRTILPADQVVGGAFGENFTVEHLTEQDLCIGDIFSIGAAKVQVSQPRQPCWKLARRWNIKDLALQVERTGYTGWYFRVVQEGLVEEGQSLELIERLCPDWTIAAANTLMHHDRDNRAAAEQLSRCEFLSTSWQLTLRKRAMSRPEAAPQQRRFNQSPS